MALIRFTGPSFDDQVNERRIVCGGWREWQSEGEGEANVRDRQTGPSGADGCVRPSVSIDYRLAAGTFAASAAVGIVVTRPWVPVACAGTIAGVGNAGDGVRPSALRTSASSLAMVSL